MIYLIDTHAMLWFSENDSQLTDRVKNIFLDPSNDLFLSTASVWEMAIKISINKLRMETELSEYLQEHVIDNDIAILNIELHHIYGLNSLEFHHRDPFDRLLIAQALTENISIISNDRHFDDYPVHRVW